MNIKDLFAPSAKGLGGAATPSLLGAILSLSGQNLQAGVGSVTLLRRAAMMLLMMMLTATTAWAEEVQVAYAVTYSTLTQKTTLTHNGGNYESVSWDYMSGINSTPWNAGYSYGVNDGYGITFKPSKYLTLAGSVLRTSAETTFTITVSDDNAYYIKSASIGGVTANAGLNAKSLEVTVPDDSNILGFNVTLTTDSYYTVTPASGLTVTSSATVTEGNTKYYKAGTTVTIAPTSQYKIVEGTGGTGSATVSVAADKRSFSFTMPEQNVSPTATLTEVYAVTPASGLQVTSTAYFTYSNTKYYKPYTTVTVAPTNQYHIVEGTGGTGSATATIAADKRSFWFTMRAQDVSPSATLTEVHTISSPSGLTVTTQAYFTYNSTTYYKKGETYTLTADADKAIQSLTATGGATSDVAADKRSATVTIGSSDVTVSATFQTIRGTTTDGLSWSLALDGSGNYTRLTISGTGEMTNYGYTTDGVTTTWRTKAPWGWHLTSVTIGNGVTTIGNFAFCGCQSLATATIGNSVTVIGQKAFDHCDALTTVTLPASVTSLHQGAFYNCVNLERIDIGHDGAVSLAGQVFENDNALQYIVFPSIEAEQANTTGNWSAFDKKRRAKFGNRHFGVTTETGTAVYAIATGDDLRNLAAAVNAGNKGSGKTFLQTANIDLASGGNFPMIGTYINPDKQFGGTYDGGGHTISGLTVSKDDINVGLFSDVDGGTIRDVILVSPTVTNTYTIDKKTSAGALVGCLSGSSTVENCHAISPNVSSTGTGDEAKYLGALIGVCTSDEPTATNCYYYGGNQSNAIGRVEGNGINVTRVSAAHLVTLGDGVSIQTEMADDLGFSYDSDGDGQAENYWREGAELALADLPTADPGQHYRYAYTYGSTVLSGTTLTVADQDYTVAIIQQPIDWASQSSGDDAEHAYMIYTKDQLLLLAHRVNGTHGETANAYKGKFFKLGADIAFEHADNEGDNYAENYEAIGGNYNGSWPFFGGDFDGDGYTISGIRINKYLTDLGLFGLISADANIHDVHLTDAHIKGYSYVGGIVGENRHGTVSGCTVTESTITAADNDCGTICGINGNGTLSHNYYRHCTVNGTANATGKGCKGADITANQGAMPAYLVTLGDGVSIVTEMADDLGFSYHGTYYWRVGAELTLGSNAPIGYGPVYSANGTALSGYTYTVNSSDGDVTLTATTDYSIITYTITYHAGGGVTFSTDKNSYTIKSADITLDTPTREGYTFLGWYDNKELTGTAVETIAAGSTGNKEFWAKWDIPYIDANGNTQYRSNYTELTNATDIGNLSAGWYVVTENVSYSSQFLCRSGDIHLILCDGAKMTVENSAEAIEMTNGSSLTIYAQSTGSSMGQLAATASHYSGIDVIDGSITICGGNITAKGSSGYASIFAKRSITIHSGQVNASGDSGIRSDGTITLGLRNATDYITATSYLGTVNIAQGQTLTDGTAFYSGNNVSIPGGKTLRPLETLDLSDNGNNAEAIWEAAASTGGSPYDVILSGRTIYRDGDWNTLCLPFALSAEQMAASPLSGATIMELDGAGSHLTGGTLTLNFNAATEMEAGRPYIVKWPLARVISTSDDWHSFVAAVAGGNTYEGKLVRLAADIEVSEMVGTSDHKFKGIFDGQGHTLTLNSLSAPGEAACAPFRYVEGATIANLHTTGTVIADNNASKFRSGLVGRSEGNTTIHNCWSSVTIQSSVNGDGTHGGFIGLSDSGYATISNCLFDGSFISISSTNSWGGFVGWSSSMTTISNSVFAPECISIDHTSSATFCRNQVVTTNCYYSQALDKTNGATAIGSRSADDLAAALGSGWQVEDGKTVPVTATINIVNPVFSVVTIDDTNRDVTFTGGSFKGTYESITFNEENQSILLLGDNSTLYWPQPSGGNIPSIGACRAYFQLNDPESTVRQFVLNFGDAGSADGSSASGIVSMDNGKWIMDNEAGAWFDLNGRRLSGKPTKKGLYINNGRKVAIK